MKLSIYVPCICALNSAICVLSEIPEAGMPPLTPGTNQKMSQALMASFKSFEKDRQALSIPNGMFCCLMHCKDLAHAIICLNEIFSITIIACCIGS